MGITYIGPINGHRVEDLCDAFAMAKRLNRPVLLHVITKKGKGYWPAEKNPMKFHGIGEFNSKSGSTGDSGNKKSNSKIFGDKLVSLAKQDERIIAVSASMTHSTGLAPFAEQFPERFFDVGIAEQHAVTMAAGMAATGFKPVVAIYSTFFQRAYDQLLHDVCLQKLPMVFAIDRAGFVGEDGETHQGVYDIAYFMTLPGMTILSPASTFELEAMLEFALKQPGPVALRYNRGLLPSLPMTRPIVAGKWETLRLASRVTVIATGRLVATAIRGSAGLDVGVINARFIKPMDVGRLDDIIGRATDIVTMEDGISNSGMGSAIAQYVAERKPTVRVHCLGAPVDMPMAQMSVAQQDEVAGISVAALRSKLIELLEGGEAQ